LHAGDGGHHRFDGDVVRLRRSATDTHALAAPHVAVISGAAGDGEVEVGAFEQARGRRGLGDEPGIDRRQQALGEQFGLEDATVEQHGGRMQKGGVGRQRAAEALEIGRRGDLPGKESGQVTGDGGVLRVRQAELGQAGAAATLRPIGDRRRREEAFEQRRGEFLARQFAAQRAADQRAPRLATTSGTAARSGSLSSASLAARQAWVSARSCQASSLLPCAASLPATA
jgi:hypothetical protein